MSSTCAAAAGEESSGWLNNEFSFAERSKVSFAASEVDCDDDVLPSFELAGGFWGVPIDAHQESSSPSFMTL